MSEAASPVSMNETFELNAPQADNKPLRDCVDTALKNYFQNLEGHPVQDMYDMVLQEVEAPLFHAIMDYTKGNQSKAAILLGINRGTLRKKLKRYGLHD